MSKRINPYIRDMTYTLLLEYCKNNEYDISRAVDELLYGRLSYLLAAKQDATDIVNEEEHEPTPEELREYAKTDRIIEELREKWKRH